MHFDELYQEIIMDHASHPRNYGEMEGATVRVEAENPSCGDELVLFLKAGEDGKVSAVKFVGHACAICTASASLMTTQVRGRERAVCRELSKAFQRMVAGDGVVQESLGPLRALEGVRKFPLRVKCGTLPWHALEQALDQLEGS
jgi:nitrogen fixation protein NifU and related proteins